MDQNRAENTHSDLKDFMWKRVSCYLFFCLLYLF